MLGSYKSDALYDEFKRVKGVLRYRRKHAPVRVFAESTEILEKRFRELLQRFPPKKKLPISPEVKRRNILFFQANVERGILKKQAAKEYNDFMAAWKAKWEPILGQKSRKSRQARRRELLMRYSLSVGDSGLAKQLFIIRRGPAKCYWCERLLPNGATVDHIVPLAKGGKHSSDNICAACSDCNSEKSDQMPDKFHSGVLF